MKKIHAGQIWWGYAEFPGDFYIKNYKNYKAGQQKKRPFLILKTNKDGTARVAYSTSKANPKYCFNVKNKNNNFYFNPNDTYDLPINKLGYFEKDLYGTKLYNIFKNFKKRAIKKYSSDPYRAAYEKNLSEGKFDQLSRRQKKLNRRNQFSPERQKQLFNPFYKEERKKLIDEWKNTVKKETLRGVAYVGKGCLKENGRYEIPILMNKKIGVLGIDCLEKDSEKLKQGRQFVIEDCNKRNMSFDGKEVKTNEERKEIYKHFYVLCNSELSSHVKSRYEKHLKNDTDYIFLKDKVEKSYYSQKADKMKETNALANQPTSEAREIAHKQNEVEQNIKEKAKDFYKKSDFKKSDEKRDEIKQKAFLKR